VFIFCLQPFFIKYYPTLAYLGIEGDHDDGLRHYCLGNWRDRLASQFRDVPLFQVKVAQRKVKAMDTKLDHKQMFKDSLRLYFAPLVGAFKGVRDEMRRISARQESQDKQIAKR